MATPEATSTDPTVNRSASGPNTPVPIGVTMAVTNPDTRPCACGSTVSWSTVIGVAPTIRSDVR